MTLIKLGYDPKEQFNWKVLSNDYIDLMYNNKFVININTLLWKKVQNIILVRKKGFDSIILIDGDRRTGKSTIAKTIAYLLNSDLTIDNYVAGLQEAPDKLDKAVDESVLIFDEGSLVANSKESMRTLNVNLEKIVDVIGQKKLCLIFCMPSFFNISRSIAVSHSRFLIHTYVDKDLNRGRFVYFSTKRKKFLYIIGKKNNHAYNKPAANFNGRFVDFKLPFEDEYLRLKMDSLKEALNPDPKKKNEVSKLQRAKLVTELMINFKENCPEVANEVISKGFNISSREFYRRKRGVSDNEV